MKRYFDLAVSMIHGISGLLVIVTLPISVLVSFGSKATVPSTIGLLLALYFITGLGMVYSTFRAAEEGEGFYEQARARISQYIESQPVNTPQYLYGYQNLRLLQGKRRDELKVLIVLILLSVVNQVPILNVLPMVYYLNRTVSRLRALALTSFNTGLPVNREVMRDNLALEVLTIVTNGTTLGLMTARVHSMILALGSSLPQPSPGLSQGTPSYG
jgi:hypothetical protein